MVTVITGTTNKPVSSERLKDYFKSNMDLNGTLYIGYPIIGTVEGAYPIDALWVSKERGIVVFNLVEGRSLDNYESEQDNSYNKLEARLKGHRELVKKRELQVEINIITFAPSVALIPQDDDYPVCNEDTLTNLIRDLAWNNPEYYSSLVSVLQSVSSIRKNRKKREVKGNESRGAKLQKLEDSIANLDNAQGRAVIETVEGVQRIRGLAGSGKTIVLALKAAYLHAQHPEWKIAITFNTRSLKGQFRQLINSFYIEQTSMEPDWDNLEIIHAWGSNINSPGIYYNFCMNNKVVYFDYSAAKSQYGRNMAFDGVCQRAISEAVEISSLYDVILIDEAQDFPVSFLQLCYKILSEPKRLVYAYDELQNLNLQSLPSPEKVFGNNDRGYPNVQFVFEQDGSSKQDIILEKCYRNSRQALVTAHALGFGIYREPDYYSDVGLVQMFEQKNLWTEIGYSIIEGELREGQRVVLARTENSSPKFLENHSSVEDLILFKTFKTKKEQDEWVANEISKNLSEDALRADDIIVINPDPITTKEAVSKIRGILYNKKIQSHVAGVDSSPDIFFDSDKDSVAFTGVYRAKGNEAAMVYVINAQDCFQKNNIMLPSSENAKIRNRLFVAITRSKAWVRVVGFGNQMKELEKEYEKVKEKNFTLDFIYPTKEQMEFLNIVNRDISTAEKENITNRRQSFSDILQDLEEGKIYFEDLGVEQVEKLQSLLNRRKLDESSKESIKPD